MDIRSAPIFDRADQIIEGAVTVMEALRAFPDHMQAGDWRAELFALRKRSLSAYCMARLIVTEKYAAEDALRANPETCPRCQGLVYYPHPSNPNRELMCGCPLAEAVVRGKTVVQDAIDRMVEDRLPDPLEGAQVNLFEAAR